MILFDKLLANVAKKPKFVHFDDPDIKRIFLENWDIDKDGRIAIEEAMSVNGILKSVFRGLNSDNGTIDLSLFQNLTLIGGNAFRSIKHASKLVMPNSVTAYDTCFYGSSIDTIIIPSITSVSSLCWGLTFNNIVIKSAEPPVKGIHEVGYGWQKKLTSKIFVPDESVDNYKQSEAFSSVASYIYPLSEYNDN